MRGNSYANLLGVGIAVSSIILAMRLWTSSNINSRQDSHESTISQQQILQEQPTQIDYEWVMLTETFQPNHYQANPYVANGYFGQTLPAEGVGYWIQKNDGIPGEAWSVNNWPLDEPRATFGTITGFWDLQKRTNRVIWQPNLKNGGESVISGIPDWTGLVVTVPSGESYAPGVDATTILAYSQSKSLHNGVVQTNVTWKPKTMETIFQLQYTVLAHQKHINLGLVRLDIMVSSDTHIFVTDILDGGGATRTDFLEKGFHKLDDIIWTSVSPWGVGKTEAYEFSIVELQLTNPEDLKRAQSSHEDASHRPWVSQNASTIAQSWNLHVKCCNHITIYKYVGIASSDAFGKNAKSVASDTALDARKRGWRELITSHENSWEALWDEVDITVSGNADMQKTARASLSHLVANLRPGAKASGLSDNSISPSGIVSDSYGGYVFWDADVWVAPGLLSLLPDYAMNINSYRLRLLKQARRNSDTNEFTKMEGAIFPWTSGRYGQCTGNGICAGYQYHINADIALAHWHYFLHTNDVEWLKEKGWPIISNAAELFTSFVDVSLTWSKGKHWTWSVTDPDEDAIQVNDGAYTNVQIKLLLGTWAPAAARILNITIPETWARIARDIPVPMNDEKTLIKEFDSMEGDITIKQADIVLLSYPLEYPYRNEIARNNLDYYATRNSPLGPQMTWSAHAISESQLQESGCAAYTYMLYSSLPYLRPPFFQFSELLIDDASINGGTEPAFPFLTGHGGFLQIFTHGLTGMRARLDAFYLDPTLPPHLGNGGVQVKGMKWQGAVFDIDIQLDTTRITRRQPKFSTSMRTGHVTVRIGHQNAKAGDYELRIGQSLDVPTRRPDLRTHGNKALCNPVSSNSSWVTGRFPLSAVDGSLSTVWQSTQANLPVRLSVDLGAVVEDISNVEIDWASIPARGFAIEISHGEEMEHYKQVLRNEHVIISAPYNPLLAKEVRVSRGNVTREMFREKVSGRYVNLTIWGTLGDDDSVGATVAEFKIF